MRQAPGQRNVASPQDSQERLQDLHIVLPLVFERLPFAVLYTTVARLSRAWRAWAGEERTRRRYAITACWLRPRYIPTWHLQENWDNWKDRLRTVVEAAAFHGQIESLEWIQAQLTRPWPLPTGALCGAAAQGVCAH